LEASLYTFGIWDEFVAMFDDIRRTRSARFRGALVCGPGHAAEHRDRKPYLQDNGIVPDHGAHAKHLFEKHPVHFHLRLDDRLSPTL
jgi:hypothetical protein